MDNWSRYLSIALTLNSVLHYLCTSAEPGEAGSFHLWGQKENKMTFELKLHESRAPCAVCVFVLTVHESLQALHQGFDGAGEVPRVLLDVLVDDVATANRPIFCLAELCLTRNV